VIGTSDCLHATRDGTNTHCTALHCSHLLMTCNGCSGWHTGMDLLLNTRRLRLRSVAHQFRQGIDRPHLLQYYVTYVGRFNPGTRTTWLLLP